MKTGSLSRLWMTPEDVRVLLGFGKVDSVYRLIATGALAAANVSPSGGRPLWRISSQAIDQFLRDRASTPPPLTARQNKRPRQAPAVTEYF